MRNFSPIEGLIAAVEADAASITAWQVGMYGMMAAIQFGWFEAFYGAPAPVPSPEFWFAMQVAMLAGFVTSYPVNWWLIRIGVKDVITSYSIHYTKLYDASRPPRCASPRN